MHKPSRMQCENRVNYMTNSVRFNYTPRKSGKYVTVVLHDYITGLYQKVKYLHVTAKESGEHRHKTSLRSI